MIDLFPHNYEYSPHFSQFYQRITFDTKDAILYHRTTIEALSSDEGILSKLANSSQIHLRLTQCKNVHGDVGDGKYGKKYLEQLYSSLQCPIHNLDSIIDDFRNGLYMICFCEKNNNRNLSRYGNIILGFEASYLSKCISNIFRCVYDDLPEENYRFHTNSRLLPCNWYASLAQKEVNMLPNILLPLVKSTEFKEEQEIRAYEIINDTTSTQYIYVDVPREALATIQIDSKCQCTRNKVKSLLCKTGLIELLQDA